MSTDYLPGDDLLDLRLGDGGVAPCINTHVNGAGGIVDSLGIVGVAVNEPVALIIRPKSAVSVVADVSEAVGKVADLDRLIGDSRDDLAVENSEANRFIVRLPLSPLREHLVAAIVISWDEVLVTVELPHELDGRLKAPHHDVTNKPNLIGWSDDGVMVVEQSLVHSGDVRDLDDGIAESEMNGVIHVEGPRREVDYVVVPDVVV